MATTKVKKKPKKRRTRTEHRGVKLKRRVLPSGATAWRAIYVDPDTQKTTYITLKGRDGATAPARTLWAIRKSEAIAKRKMALADGAVHATGKSLSEVIAVYYSAHPKLRPATLTAYKAATNKLVTWAASEGVDADKLTKAALTRFRTSLVKEPKLVAARGHKRGKRKAAPVLRSGVSVNRELRSVVTALRYLIDCESFSRLNHNDLRLALKREQVTHERLAYLDSNEIRKLLEACQRHDAEVYTLDRADKAAGRKPGEGTTARYEQIKAFVIVTLLSGMRLSEVLQLRWDHVVLDAKDSSGAGVGEIRLPGSTNKTNRARTIDLGVSPALRSTMLALKVRTGGEGYVFPTYRARTTVEAAAKRLRGEYGAPKSFTWQALRRTCGTFLTNAPGIFGAASAYRSARQLGHSVTIAEKHYVDLERGIPATARTLEDAMSIADLLKTTDKPAGANVARLRRA